VTVTPNIPVFYCKKWVISLRSSEAGPVNMYSETT